METQQAQPVLTAIATGSMPPLAGGFIVRSETGGVLETRLLPGTTVALVSARSAADGGVGRGWRDSSGKTQLAVSVAQALRQRAEVDLVVWVTATSRASVLSGYAEAAAALGGQVWGDADSVATRFVGWLRDSGRPWLVVLDDLTASAALDDVLWPTGPTGRVLVTTAESATVSGRGAQIVPIGAFSRREGLAYLIGRLAADLDQRQGAIDLAADLDGEPLALAQSSAVIANSELTCHDYREHFVRRRDQMAESAGSGPAAGAITWSLSVDHADRLSSGAAQPLVVLAALLDGNAIPGVVLERYGPAHADTDTATAGASLGLALVSAGRFGEAVTVLTEAVGDRERSHGADSLVALTVREDLAAAYRGAGLFVDAIGLYGRALAQRANHPDTLAACLNLAHAYYAVGRRGDAVKLLTETVERCDAVLPTDDALRNAARSSLSNIGGVNS